MSIRPDWHNLDKFIENCGPWACDLVTYAANSESKITYAGDFESKGDFEQGIWDFLNVHSHDGVVLDDPDEGEQLASEFFVEKCQNISKTIVKGSVEINWLTCEAEDSRIDLKFEKDNCMYRVHQDVVEIDDDE